MSNYDNESLGSCGCTDYHMADCPTRTGYADAWAQAERDFEDYGFGFYD